MSEERIYIPIGEDCYSTMHLQKEKLRKFATIFDWIVIRPITILHLFKNDFKNFFLKDNLKIVKNSTRKFKHVDLEVMDTYYNILIPHHINNLDKDYDNICNKFHERIKRLDQMLFERDTIYFVYKPTKSYEIKYFPPEMHSDFGVTNMKKHEQELKDVIMKKYNTNIEFIYI